MRLILFLGCLIIPGLTNSQNCYKDYLQRGIEAYNSLNFENSINLFNAAKICPDITEEQYEEVISWHDRVSTGYIDAIKKARDEAINAQEAAVKAQTEAENQARLTEANRRAYLATQELEDGNWDDALLLAFSARDLAGSDPLPLVDNAFGQVVALALSVHLESNESHQLEMGQLSNSTVWARSNDGFIRFWDFRGKLINKTGEEGVPIKQVWISPDESHFLTQYKTPPLKLWDDKGNLIARLTENEDHFSSAAFSTEGKEVITGSRNGRINIRDLKGSILTDTKLHNDPVYEVSFLESETIITRSGDRTVRFLDTQGKIKAEIMHDLHIYSVDISPDHRNVVTASADKTAGLWNTNGNLITKLTHPAIVYKAVFSPSGKAVWTLCMDGNVRKWSLTGEKLLELEHPSSIMQLSTGGNQILTVAGKQSIVWSEQGVRKCIVNHDNDIIGACFSPDGKLLLTYSQDRARLWDLTGKMIMEIKSFDKIESSETDISGRISADIVPGGVRHAEFSNDGALILTLSEDGEIFITRNPINVFNDMKTNPPEFSDEMKRQYGI